LLKHRKHYILMSVETHNTPSFSVVVPILDPDLELWNHFLESVAMQSMQPTAFIVIDSGSSLEVIHACEAYGAEVVSIEQGQFDHALTRRQALQMVSETSDYVVYMTQDAILIGRHAFKELISAFSDSSVSAVYGKHVPRSAATPIESHARFFNYPLDAEKRTLHDKKFFGLKTVFFSNSFAAYRANALVQLEAFSKSLIMAEDSFVAAQLLLRGHAIQYQPTAMVFHSHNYSLRQEFNRYFDIGVFHSSEPWIRQLFGGAEWMGWLFLKSQMKYLWQVERLFKRANAAAT